MLVPDELACSYEVLGLTGQRDWLHNSATTRALTLRENSARSRLAKTVCAMDT